MLSFKAFVIVIKQSNKSQYLDDMSSHPRSKAIYVGPFIHSRSLQNLEICADGAIGVDESGTIAFVERDSSSIKAALTRDDWIDAPRVRVQGKGFFFPGFIGMRYLHFTPPLQPKSFLR